MKINGIDPKTLPNKEVLVLPRGETQIVFYAQGLSSMDEFNKLMPDPKPPGKMTPTGIIPQYDDPSYLLVIEEFVKRKFSYMVIRSLEPSNIEWDNVKLDNPGTWNNWEQELKDNGLLQAECNKIAALVLQANALDEAKLQQARDSFLRGLTPVSAL